MDTGLFLIRVVFGLMMVGHAGQKLFGWLGGYGLAGTAGYFEQLGFRPGKLFVTTASLTELVSGILVVLGLFGPIGPALMLSVMIVAAISVHAHNGLFAMTSGIEVPLLYGSAATGLALIGFGTYSLDWALGLTELWTPTTSVGALGLGVLGAIANLSLRKPAAQASAAA
jgi:putative oxidoreductase